MLILIITSRYIVYLYFYVNAIWVHGIWEVLIPPLPSVARNVIHLEFQVPQGEGRVGLQVTFESMKAACGGPRGILY